VNARVLLQAFFLCEVTTSIITTESTDEESVTSNAQPVFGPTCAHAVTDLPGCATMRPAGDREPRHDGQNRVKLLPLAVVRPQEANNAVKTVARGKQREDTAARAPKFTQTQAEPSGRYVP
jgi:hypothetical protein